MSGGRSDRSLFRRMFGGSKKPRRSVKELLIQQVDMAIEAAELAAQVLEREAGKEEAKRPMRSIQHEGYDLHETLTERIDMVVAVPMEREDLVRASRTVGDITDNLRDIVREMAMWDVHRGEWCEGLLDPAIKSLNAIKVAIETSDPTVARVNCLKSRHHARKLRRYSQHGLSIIFSEEFSMMTLKRRQVLSLADSISKRLAETSDAILDGLIKRYM